MWKYIAIQDKGHIWKYTRWRHTQPATPAHINYIWVVQLMFQQLNSFTCPSGSYNQNCNFLIHWNYKPGCTIYRLHTWKSVYYWKTYLFSRSASKCKCNIFLKSGYYFWSLEHFARSPASGRHVKTGERSPGCTHHVGIYLSATIVTYLSHFLTHETASAWSQKALLTLWGLLSQVCDTGLPRLYLNWPARPLRVIKTGQFK